MVVPGVDWFRVPNVLEYFEQKNEYRLDADGVRLGSSSDTTVVDWRAKPLKPVPYKLTNGGRKYAEFRKEDRRAPFKAMCPPSVYRAYQRMLMEAHECVVMFLVALGPC